MGKKTSARTKARVARQRRVRRKVLGTTHRPRLCVFRSSRYTSAQLIADDEGRVLAATSSRELAGKDTPAANKEWAKKVGEKIAEIAKEKKIEQVVFDRNGYLYHGRVAAVAEGARESGLQF